MSRLKNAIEKYASGEKSCQETAHFLLSLHILPSASSTAEGTWAEVEFLFNEGVMDFMQFRSLTREYREAHNNPKIFTILWDDYGYRDT